MQELLQSVPKMIIRFPLHLWPDHVGVPILGGPLKGRLLPKETAQQNLQMWFGGYESIVVLELLSTPKPIRVAYDVGAHVGYMTMILAERVTKGGAVFAFEPIPTNQALIGKMIDLNNLHGKVRLVSLALGDTIGEERMVVWESSLMNQLEMTAVGKIVTGRPTINTRVSTLDSFVLGQLNPPPELIKIDVEGAEALVIAGGLETLRRFSPKLLLEVHGPGSADRTYELLQGVEYEWWRLRENGSQKVTDKQHLLSFFSKESWTQHFMITRKKSI